MPLELTGRFVRTWFDTGALGATLLYGQIVSSGPKTFTVRWESGLKNRLAIERLGYDVTLVPEGDLDDLARSLLRRPLD
jgi:hypothetical protein